MGVEVNTGVADGVAVAEVNSKGVGIAVRVGLGVEVGVGVGVLVGLTSSIWLELFFSCRIGQAQTIPF